MKKIVLMLMMAVAAISAHAQKYALVDMEYILRNIPAYERANEQLNQVSRKWQAEVEALNLEGEGSQRPEEEILRCRGRTLQEARGTDGTYPGGDLQCREGDFQPARLLACSRQSQQQWNHFWLAKNRHQQRGTPEVLFQEII